MTGVMDVTGVTRVTCAILGKMMQQNLMAMKEKSFHRTTWHKTLYITFGILTSYRYRKCNDTHATTRDGRDNAQRTAFH